MKTENYAEEVSNGADAERPAGPDVTVSLQPHAGSNLSWPLVAYLGTMTVLLLIVAVWDSTA